MTLSKLFLLFLIFQLTFIEITARGGGGHSSGGGGHSSSSSGGSHVSAPSTPSVSKPTTTTAPSTTPTKPTTTSTKPTTTGDTSSETPTTSTPKPTTTDTSSETPTTSTTKPTTTTSGGKPATTVTIAGRRYVAVDSAEYTSSDIQSSLYTGIGAVNQNLEGVLPSRLGTPKINKVQRQEDVPTNYVYDVSLTGSKGFLLRTIFLVDATTSDVSVLSYNYEYPTNLLEDVLTEENQESEWLLEYETYEFDENGEFVGDGLTPVSLDAAESDQAIQDALNFGNTFVINKATKTGELKANETEFKQLLAVSSKTVNGGVEYEFHVEIGDPNVDEESEWMHVFFAVYVEEASGTKEVISYSVLSLFETE